MLGFLRVWRRVCRCSRHQFVDEFGQLSPEARSLVRSQIALALIGAHDAINGLHRLSQFSHRLLPMAGGDGVIIAQRHRQLLVNIAHI